MKQTNILCLLCIFSATLVYGSVLKFESLKGPAGFLQSLFDFKQWSKVEKIPNDVYDDRVITSGSVLDKHTGKLGKYVFKNCGDASKDVFVLSSLVIMPDPIQLPGSVTFSFNGTSRLTINAPVKANVTIAKEDPDTHDYEKLPCIGQIGSCVYDDFCQILSQIGECPPQLTNIGITCHCPISQGTYNLPGTQFDIETSLLASGNYYVSGNFTQGMTTIGCYEIYFTFA